MVHSPDGFEQTPSKAKDENESSRSNLAGRNKPGLDWTHGISQ